MEGRDSSPGGNSTLGGGSLFYTPLEMVKRILYLHFRWMQADKNRKHSEVNRTTTGKHNPNRTDHHLQEANHQETGSDEEQDHCQVEAFQAYFQEDKTDLEEDQKGPGPVCYGQCFHEHR